MLNAGGIRNGAIFSGYRNDRMVMGEQICKSFHNTHHISGRRAERIGLGSERTITALVELQTHPIRRIHLGWTATLQIHGIQIYVENLLLPIHHLELICNVKLFHIAGISFNRRIDR